MEEKNEIEIRDSFEPVSIKQTIDILEQMQTCVCKINVGAKKGTGFFTKIPYKNIFLPVLITNYHVLNEEKISIGKNITLSLNNNKKRINIKIDEERKRYANEILDVTIIELKEIDKINNFLDLDESIKDVINSNEDEKDDYFNNLYENESIYILSYMNEIFSSYGLLTKISDGKIFHKCYTNEGASGSPILLLKTNNVIGVHYGGSKYNFNSNFGRLLIKSIKEFQAITNNLLIIKNNEEINEKENINNNLNNILMNQDNLKYNNVNFNTIVSKNEDIINEQINLNTINNNDNNNNSQNSNEMQTQITFKNVNESFFASSGLQTEVNNNNNQENINYLKCFKHLIKHAYFKKDLLKLNNQFNKDLIKAYLINKSIINKLLQIYNLEKIMIMEILKEDKLKGVTYHNFNQNYYRISNYLKEIGINPTDKIEQGVNFEQIHLTENEKIIEPKKFNYIIESKCVDEFEIINKRFSNFLEKTFEGIMILPVFFGTIKNNKVLVVINHEEETFYQIMSLDKNNNLIFEYLIEIVNNKGYQHMEAINNYIYGLLIKNDIRSLIKKGNPIQIDNIDVTFNLYSKICSSNINIPQTHRILRNSPTEMTYTIKNIGKTSDFFGGDNDENDFSKTITIIFKINNKVDIEIIIDSDKKIIELIKLFLKIMKRPHLFKNKEVIFYYNNKYIEHDSKQLIRNIFNNDKGSKIVFVNIPAYLINI